MKKEKKQKEEIKRYEANLEEIKTNEINITLSSKEPIEAVIKNTSSVEMKRNSKGGVEFIVKIYDIDPIAAMKTANLMYNTLAKKHPIA